MALTSNVGSPSSSSLSWHTAHGGAAISSTRSSNQRPAKMPAHRLLAPAETATPVRDNEPPVGSAPNNPPTRFAAPWAVKSADVLGLLPSGLGTAAAIPAPILSRPPEIAAMLEISRHTALTYVRRIYSKLKVRSKAEAIFEANIATLEKLASMTNDATPPEGACNTWRALYAGIAQLGDDLINHIHLENNVLFPRFEASAAPAQACATSACGCQ